MTPQTSGHADIPETAEGVEHESAGGTDHTNEVAERLDRHFSRDCG